MTNSTKTSATCKWCGASLEATHIGPCPKCGKEGKNVTVGLTSIESISSSVNWEKRQKFLKINKKIRNIIIIITIISPFIGLFLSGIIGVVIGLAFGILNYILSPFAIMKVLEIEKGGSKDVSG